MNETKHRDLGLAIREQHLGPVAVYVIQATMGGPFKVGIGMNPTKRLQMVQVGNPYDLEVVAVMWCEGAHNAKQEENELHNLLNPWKMRGEWFWPEPECVNELEMHMREAVGKVKMNLDSIRAVEELCRG